ncbi:tyrosine-type recombinase/integrase [Actinocatenispora rupis]|uniref:Integrase n=1 Tax=Actinocatenispora rupis TaxID=519421 RepID=A0A8J3J7I0_9ACTN|nr:tyrosine-type recombinase/integrase [Actinocatenispora rupis]GID13066.1 integrase [Actinocatenispora rupis]
MTRQSYAVRIWAIRKYKGARKTTYTVRWAVEGNEFPKTFATKKLAESFHAQLTTAAREGEPFDVESGLPVSMARELNKRSWYEHACGFVDMKWPRASGRHRKSIAEALATVSFALFSTTRGMPDRAELRRALYTWSFNTAARASDPEQAVSRAVRWAAANTVDIADMKDPVVTRRALDALAVTLDGKPAAPTTIARKRAVLYGALRYAVELGYLDANPIDRVQWKVPKTTEEVDRRVVVNPAQARRLLAAVREEAPELEALFACMYYAALRPAEALHLRESDLFLPNEDGADPWGELLLTGSTQHVGAAWADDGSARQDRALKHRAANATRPVPACPDLVRVLRRHLAEFGTGPDGRLFVPRVGKFGRPVAGASSASVSVSTYTRVWRAARKAALTPAEFASPLARRPYDLRHAAVSLQLNAGVPATQVAEWAGHSVAVLLKVYAACLYGQEDAARRRIVAALSSSSESEGPDETSPRIRHGQP